MIDDVKVFKNRSYIVKNGKIGYKEYDGITYTTSYGY